MSKPESDAALHGLGKYTIYTSPLLFKEDSVGKNYIEKPVHLN